MLQAHGDGADSQVQVNHVYYSSMAHLNTAIDTTDAMYECVLIVHVVLIDILEVLVGLCLWWNHYDIMANVKSCQ